MVVTQLSSSTQSNTQNLNFYHNIYRHLKLLQIKAVKFVSEIWHSCQNTSWSICNCCSYRGNFRMSPLVSVTLSLSHTHAHIFLYIYTQTVVCWVIFCCIHFSVHAYDFPYGRQFSINMIKQSLQRDICKISSSVDWHKHPRGKGIV